MFSPQHRVRVTQISNITSKAHHHKWLAEAGFEPQDVAQAKIEKLNKAAVIAWQKRDAWQAAMCRRSPSCAALRDILKTCSPKYYIGDIDISMQEIMGGFGGYGLVQYVAVIRECGVDLVYQGSTRTIEMIRKMGVATLGYFIVSFGKARKVTEDEAAKWVNRQPKVKADGIVYG